MGLGLGARHNCIKYHNDKRDKSTVDRNVCMEQLVDSKVGSELRLGQAKAKYFFFFSSRAYGPAGLGPSRVRAPQG